mgnify:CR=1 FL=1|jgi:hypothetical protein
MDNASLKSVESIHSNDSMKKRKKKNKNKKRNASVDLSMDGES